MNEIQKLEKRIEKEVSLKNYKGGDRIVYAEDKSKEIEEERKFRPSFRAITNLPALNECVDGFRKGQLIIIAGPPKHGKSQLGVSFTADFWEKYRCLWFEYELGYEEFLDRFPKNKEGKLDFYIPNYMDSGNLSWVEDKIIEGKAKFNTEIVFIDLLDFLRDPEILRGVSINLSAYIGSLVQRIKRIAVEQNILIFLMSHIRKNEWTKNDVPDSEELRDSGQIAQLADIVIMIIRKRADKKTQPDEVYDGNKAVLGIMANRHNGRTKKIPLIYNFDERKFYEDYEARTNDNLVGTKSDWL